MKSDLASLVTYFDFGPSFITEATQGLRAWAASIRRESEVIEMILLSEVNRPERFALMEIWTEMAQLSAHQASGARSLSSIAASLCAPPDERIGEPFTIGTAQSGGTEASLFVLVHVDVLPFNLMAVGEWLKTQAQAARLESGALRYDVWRQTDRPNHFTVIQIWADRNAYAHHVESAATQAFRANLRTVKGSLYDERLYQRVD